MFNRLLCVLVMLAFATSAAPLSAQTAKPGLKVAQKTTKSTAKRRRSKPAAKPKKTIKKVVLTGACADYHSERAKLEAAGVREVLKQNAADVAATLSPEALENVRRLITLDEKLMFECRVIDRQVALKKPNPVKPVDTGATPDLPTRRPKRSTSPNGVDKSPVPLPIRSVR